MSLLKDILRKNTALSRSDTPPQLSDTSKKSLKKYAASVRSSSAGTIRSLRSLAESVVSFSSLLTLGGSRIPKRRRPDISRLGVPKWYKGTPPKPERIAGTEWIDGATVNEFKAGHVILNNLAAPQDPESCVILYSSASPASRHARYHNEAKIPGELRLNLKKATYVSSIDVWLVGRADSRINSDNTFLRCRARLWDKSSNASAINGVNLKGGRFPAGGYVFPFEFEALPEYITARLPSADVEKDVSGLDNNYTEN
ncbi:hypothetical protein M422DRAFT_270353 [Sphaerobolus stellatus SS14]|uniref:Uncharacterized protein n=1 Tax=Sphaerobolus stellatus (strain SS14) TaxID=990650 RepID=A0A0C9USP2_SPHS4|nr:hypothetical protein M422DRAFT_270353 [Sphaerobolus stellatus SS14]